MLCNSITSVGRAFLARHGSIFLDTIPDTSVYSEYTVRVAGHVQRSLDYVSKSNSRTIWYAVGFDESTVGCTGACTNGLYVLPSLFFSETVAFGQDSVVIGSNRQWPDVQYHALMRLHSRFMRTNGEGHAGNGAFWTPGCTPLEVVFRVQFVLTKQKFSSAYYPADSAVDRDGMVLCYNRTVMLMNVRDDTTNSYQCRSTYLSDDIRRLFVTTPSTHDYTSRRMAVTQTLQNGYYASTKAGTKAVFLSDAQIGQMLDCAIPADGFVGGTWTPPTEAFAGYCAKCKAAGGSHKQTRYCNRSLESEKWVDCCFQCVSGYMWQNTECVALCRRNMAYDGTRGMCVTCPSGKFSNGGADRCKTCVERGVWNGRVDPSIGCVACGARSQAVNDVCVPCPTSPEQQIMVPGATSCMACSTKGAFFFSLNHSQCQPCAPGTYMASPGTTCVTCPVNSFSQQAGASKCTQCANGYQSVPNRTMCIACPPLNALTHPYTRYMEPGCYPRCDPALSYQVSNPYAPHGCRSCSEIVLAVGTYADKTGDCSRARPCTNVPPNGVYTGPASLGLTTCPFACKGGYQLVNSACVPCAYSASFDASKHMPTEGCEFTCKPFVFRDGAKLCNEACVDMVVRGDVYARLRDYSSHDGPSIRRPHYVIGQCGTTDTFPTSDVSFYRKARWGKFVDYSTRICGNSLLETGEECDDGNTANNDGCSSVCRVETDRYWDCDWIGTPCLPNCGWDTQTVMNRGWTLNFYGYLLPPCPAPNQCHCGNYSAYSLSKLDAFSRLAWMNQHMVSCDCNGNKQRMLAYKDCTVANRGCRPCANGQYHDDILGQCVACGGNCEAGYYASGATCLSSTSTSDNFGLPMEQQQARIGCGACPVQNVRYVKGGACRFVCYRDLTGETTINDTYCSVRVSTTDGTCPSSICKSCRVSLAARENEYSYNAQTYASKYIGSCEDVMGHAWQSCDASIKPRLAVFVKGSTVVGARTGCEWSCPSRTTYSYRGTCFACTEMPLITSASCRSGERLVSCDSNTAMRTCIPCEGHTLLPLQVWTSSVSTYFATCTEDCEPGVGYSSVAGAPCQRCTNVQCEMGERFVACTAREDARCELCSVAYGSIGRNEEYVQAGLCSTQCASGYYYDGAGCVECVPTTGTCPLGMKQTSECVDVGERRSAPSCVPCPRSLGEYEVWAIRSAKTPACAIACTLGFVISPQNRTVEQCVPCQTSLCPMGKLGLCTNSWSSTFLDCDADCPVSLRPHEEFGEPGSCTKRCVSGFIWSDYLLQCTFVAPSQSTESRTTPVTMEPSAGRIYPVRVHHHSGMSA